VLAPGVATAAPPTVLRVHPTHSPLDERMAAELSRAGFEVRDVDAGPRADLGEVARANGAAAAFRVDDDALELWVEPRSPGQAPSRETIRVEGGRGMGVTAVAALEALRARLLPVAPQGSPPRPAPESPAPIVSKLTISPAPTAPTLWLHMAVAAETSPGGLGPAGEVLAEVRVEPARWIALAALASFGPGAAHVSGPEGDAAVRRGAAGAAIDLQGRVGTATASVGAGAVIALLSVHGDAPAPGYAGTDDASVTAGPLVRLCLSLPLVPSLRIRAQLGGGATFPAAVVSFAGRQVATWGRPFALLSLGLEWGALR
jgi:hypothetical protein